MLLRLFLIALATITLSACNQSSTESPTDTESDEEPAEESSSTTPAEESSPTTVDIGGIDYVIEKDCASVEVEEGYYLYYSPTEPNYFCVHTVNQSPRPVPGGGAQVPSTCAFAPDQRFYCHSQEGQLTFATLQEFYAQGKLPVSSP